MLWYEVLKFKRFKKFENSKKFEKCMFKEFNKFNSLHVRIVFFVFFWFSVFLVFFFVFCVGFLRLRLAVLTALQFSTSVELEIKKCNYLFILNTPKVTENGSNDFLAFLHEVRGS